MDFVLDNSVAMRWILESGKRNDQRYAEQVLQSLLESAAVVPGLWHLEASNVLVQAVKGGELSVADVEGFVAQLEVLPIAIDGDTASFALNRTMVLAMNYNLSSYDAAYLELALRRNLPLATLDTALVKAARKCDVEMYLEH